MAEKPVKAKIGMCVTLKSGSPVMTVEGVGLSGQISCVWFDGSTVHRHYFEPECLLCLEEKQTEGH